MEALGLYLGCIEDKRVERSISDLPLLGDLEYQLTLERSQSVQPLWEQRRQTASKAKVVKPRSHSNAPLAAYSTYFQRPLSNDERFSEFDVEELILERTLQYISTLGYNSIRPIGIGKTLKELEYERNGSQKCSSGHASSNCRPVPVENRDEYEATTALANVADLDQEIQSEQEQSYNYDDEFDRVEEASIEPRPMERLPAGTGLVENSQIREQSYMPRAVETPEDISEFTEVSSLTMSDSILLNNLNYQEPRIPSFNAGRPGNDSGE